MVIMLIFIEMLILRFFVFLINLCCCKWISMVMFYFLEGGCFVLFLNFCYRIIYVCILFGKLVWMIESEVCVFLDKRFEWIVYF